MSGDVKVCTALQNDGLTIQRLLVIERSEKNGRWSLAAVADDETLADRYIKTNSGSVYRKSCIDLVSRRYN